MFTKRDKGVYYLVGAGDEPQIVKGAKIDAPQADAIAARARALRIARGTLAGHAAGETPVNEGPKFNVLDDLAAVWPVDEANVQNGRLVGLLVSFRPEFYAHLADLDDAERTAALTALVKPYGMTSKDVSGRDGHRKTTRRGLSRRGPRRGAQSPLTVSALAGPPAIGSRLASSGNHPRPACSRPAAHAVAGRINR